MKRNMGSSDRLIRALIAGVIAILFLTGVVTGILGIILLAVAGILVLTSFFSFCPIYLPLGISTRRQKNAQITEKPKPTIKNEVPQAKKKVSSHR